MDKNQCIGKPRNIVQEAFPLHSDYKAYSLFGKMPNVYILFDTKLLLPGEENYHFCFVFWKHEEEGHVNKYSVRGATREVC